MEITNAIRVGGQRKDAGIWHEKDKEYFKEYQAPIMEKMHGGHWTNINSTITFYGPMLYFIIRALGCEKVLEIGAAKGYTGRYMAHAIKDNAARYGMKDNIYYGIDIVSTEWLSAQMFKEDLPAKIINMDSKKLNPQTFEGIKFDLIFQDGAHDTEHVLHELDVLYPQLKGQGRGYWIFHDCYGPAEEGFQELKKMIEKGKYKFEYVRLLSVYGIAILRKTEGEDPGKKYWYLK